MRGVKVYGLNKRSLFPPFFFIYLPFLPYLPYFLLFFIPSFCFSFLFFFTYFVLGPFSSHGTTRYRRRFGFVSFEIVSSS